MNESQHKPITEKWLLREPNDEEFEKFKKDFNAKRRMKLYEKEVDKKYKEGFDKLLFKIGELQSENSELRHDISNIENLKMGLARQAQSAVDKLDHREWYISTLVGDILFYEMKLGLW